MTDDYSAPLGLDRPRPPTRRRYLLPFASALLALVLGGIVAFALFGSAPYDGQPHAVIDLPVLPAALPTPAAAVPPAPEPPDESAGEIIIRDP